MEKEYKYIIEYLLTHQSVKLDMLQDYFGKSQRTIYNYIKNVNSLLARYGASMVSSGKASYSLMIVDEKLFEPLREDLGYNVDFNDPEERISQILNILLFAEDYVKMEDLADQLYISRSLLKQDMQKIRDILKGYGLTLTVRPHYGMRVDGEELSKRACLKRNAVVSRTKTDTEKKGKMKQTIRDVLVSCMINADYRMPEDSLDNLVMHIYIAVKRMLSKT